MFVVGGHGYREAVENLSNKNLYTEHESQRLLNNLREEFELFCAVRLSNMSQY